jgi:hypothetical protein
LNAKVEIKKAVVMARRVLFNFDANAPTMMALSRIRGKLVMLFQEP